MSPHYDLTTLQDVYDKVPAARIPLCLSEIAGILQAAKQTVEDHPETELAPVFPMTWVDDGKSHRWLEVQEEGTQRVSRITLADPGERFARVFERNSRQVLLVADTNDDEAPAIRLVTQYRGVQSALSMAFANTDTGWNERDRLMSGILAADQLPETLANVVDEHHATLDQLAQEAD